MSTDLSLKDLVPKFQSEIIQYPKKIYNDKEKDELLKNYTLLKKNEYRDLKKGDHIRYVNDKGEFRRGGFIDIIFGDKIRLVRMLYTQNNGDNTPWIINLSKIDKIWRKQKKNINGGNDDIIKNINDKLIIHERLHNKNVNDLNNEITNIKNTMNIMMMTIKKMNNVIIELQRKINN